MPLSQQQLNELNIASARLGTANEGLQDRQNIDYAKRTFGYSYTPQPQMQPVQNTQPVPQVLSSNLLNQNTQFNQVQQPAPFDYNAFIKGLEPTQNSLQDFLKQYNTTETQPLQEERTGLAKTLQTSLDKLLGRSDRVAELTTQLDITGQQKSLNDLMKQIASSKANFDAQTEFVSGQPVSRQFMTGRQSAIQRQAAVELGGLSAMAEAVQGNIGASDALIARTITSEYQPVLDEIGVLQEQLKMNYDSLSSAEKKRADEMNVILDERKRNIEVEATKKKDILAIAQTAAQNGADSVTLNSIIKSATPEDATVMANKFLQTTETALTEANGRRLLINQRTGDVIKDLGAVETNYQLTTDAEGNQIVFNPRTGETTTTNVSQGVVGGYDIGTYATDPQHEQKVASILQNMGQLTTPEEIDAYIQSAAPGSPITSDMIKKTSEKYGVSWEMLIAMMQQDSSLGTAGLGARNNNPGNIGQFDSLGTQGVKGYPTLQAGVDAVGNWLAKHKVAKNNNEDALNIILSSDKFTKEQKASITKGINTGEDPFTIIKNQAKNIMGQTLATDLDKYETAKEQLVSIQDLLDSYYASGGKTNLFKGSYEKAINKLGEVDDPKLVEIATNISAALQIYRNAVSGTAYSVQEGRDIASIFPGINKSEGLNKAILTGRMNAFETTIDQKYKNTLGSVYDRLKKASKPQIQPTQSTNSNDPLGLFSK